MIRVILNVALALLVCWPAVAAAKAPTCPKLVGLWEDDMQLNQVRTHTEVTRTHVAHWMTDFTPEGPGAYFEPTTSPYRVLKANKTRCVIRYHGAAIEIRFRGNNKMTAGQGKGRRKYVRLLTNPVPEDLHAPAFAEPNLAAADQLAKVRQKLVSMRLKSPTETACKYVAGRWNKGGMETNFVVVHTATDSWSEYNGKKNRGGGERVIRLAGKPNSCLLLIVAGLRVSMEIQQFETQDRYIVTDLSGQQIRGTPMHRVSGK